MDIYDYIPETKTTYSKEKGRTSEVLPAKRKISDDIKNLVQSLLGLNRQPEQKVQQNLASPAPQKIEIAPSPAPVETSDPEQIARQMVFNYDPYIKDQALVDKNFPNGIPQPSLEQKLRMLSVSPEDATRSGILKLGETGGYNDYPEDYTGNANGSVDRGANMINSYTFEDMWNKEGMKKGTYPHRERMQNRGINSYEDMKDPKKNEAMMDLIRRVGGYDRWYGPKDKGFDLSQ